MHQKIHMHTQRLISNSAASPIMHTSFFIRLCHHCYNAERATDLWLVCYVAKLFCVQLSALYFSTSLETLLKSVFFCVYVIVKGEHLQSSRSKISHPEYSIYVFIICGYPFQLRALGSRQVLSPNHVGIRAFYFQAE